MLKNTGRPILLLLLVFAVLPAQISKGGYPQSLSVPLPQNVLVVVMPEIDTAALMEEDQRAEEGIPYRYGYRFDVAYTLENAGVWTVLDNGDRIWRLRIESRNALSLGLLYDNFWLPAGAELFLYDESMTTVLGAFTQVNNKEYGEFVTAPIPGEITILEYYEPSGTAHGTISISAVIHAYRDILGLDEADRSGWCENNVSCPEGEPWANEIRSVAKLIVGPYLCSGALINNTSLDTTQYLLTAYHCVEGSGSPGNFLFMFNFQASQCYGTWGPTNQTVSGSVMRASSQDIYNSPDFCLLELSEDIPDSYNVFYAGWSRESTLPQTPVGIHHPDGDVKKISFDYDSASHYNTYKWNVSWDDGVTEGGSSGSPLFDHNHQIVGALSTGCSFCDDQYCPDQYGKVYRSWEFGTIAEMRLRDWLDPVGSDVITLDGLDPFDDGGPTLGDLNADEIINVQDIIVVVNIILGNLIPDEYQLITGDITENGIIDVLDIITLVNIILGNG